MMKWSLKFGKNFEFEAVTYFYIKVVQRAGDVALGTRATAQEQLLRRRGCDG